MKSKAVILAGGMGTRLMPITEKIPKPMVPIAGISAFERIVNLLKNNGITNIAVTTLHLAEKIENTKVKNVDIKYFREKEPLGTAGCVKKISDELEDTFVVINGDDVCNFNIKKALDEHLKKGSEVTVLLHKTNDPTEYGNVIIKDGVITSFIEKPSWSRTVSDIINTGIYILNKSAFDDAPDGFLDFSKDLFPMLLSKGKTINGVVCDGFWYDIGDINSYYECNFSFAANLSNIIGKNVKAGKFIKASGCIIHDNVTIGEGSELKNCIICENATIGKNCKIEKGVVIGAGSVIKDNVFINKNVIIGSDIKIEKGATVVKNILFNGMKKNIFSDKGIEGIYGSDIDGELCIKLGKVLCNIYGKIGVMSDGKMKSDYLKDALLCGISGGGGEAVDNKNGFPSFSRFLIKEQSLDLSVYISVNEEKALIKIYDINGLKISHDAEKKIEKDYNDSLSYISEPKEIIRTDTEELKTKYRKYLVSLCKSPNKNKDLNLNKGNDAVEFLYDLGLFSNNSNLGSETIVVWPDNISAVCKNKDMLSYWHIVCIVFKYCFEKRKISLPIMIPHTVVKFLEKLGYDCIFYGDKESAERNEAKNDLDLRDPLSLAVMLLDISSKENKTLEELKRELPDFYVETQSFEYDDESKAHCMTELSERDGAMQLSTGGVKIIRNHGSIIVIPKYEGGFRLFAEAYSMEAANEMFIDVKKMINEVK